MTDKILEIAEVLLIVYSVVFTLTFWTGYGVDKVLKRFGR
jgi:hypothetical protein